MLGKYFPVTVSIHADAATATKQLHDEIKKEKIKKVAFDRSGYKYHGKVKALADSIRENGVKI